MTPSARSRAKWRKAGYVVDGAEAVVRIPGQLTRRSDLFGFIDLVAAGPEGVVLIQATSWGNVSARVKKILHEAQGTGQWQTAIRDVARHWLRAGVRILVEGWKLDKKTNRWVSRERWITLEDVGC